MIYIASAVFFYFQNYFFIKFWKKNNKFTPTGIGIFLIFHLIYYFLIIEYSLFYLIPLIIFSFIYFLDDLMSINFIWRLIIQILTPIIIYLASTHNLNIIFFISVITFFLCFNELTKLSRWGRFKYYNFAKYDFFYILFFFRKHINKKNFNSCINIFVCFKYL